MDQRRLKLSILVSHPIQYFVPVYRALAQRPDLEFSVLFRTRVGLDSYFDPGFGRPVQWDIPLLGGYRQKFLTSKSRLGGFEWSIVPHLLKQRPEVLLLHGYSQATNLLALLVAKLVGVRILIRGDTRSSPHHRTSGWKTRFKRMLLRMTDGCVAGGTLNRQYYESLGVPRERIYFAPICVDNAAFDLGDSRLRIRAEQRRQLGIDTDDQVILFASKLIERKRAMDLVMAIKAVRSNRRDVVLVIAGSGSEEDALHESTAGNDDWVRFVGFKNQGELPALYAASDVFVLPSQDEPWGLVVNETMAAGLPEIVSDDVGAAPDLVEGKDTGVVYRVGDIGGLTAALETLLDSPETLSRMGQNAKTLIGKWSVSASAEGIAQAAHDVFGRRSR